jgi:hypothetical protein
MEYKVLGASPRNLQAIQNALTMKGNGGDISYPKADFKYSEESGDHNFEFNFPFQMSIITDESGNASLIMEEGRIQMIQPSQDRVYVFPKNCPPLSLNNLDTGKYKVMLLLNFSKKTLEGSQYIDGGAYYYGSIYFVNADATTQMVPSCNGVLTIPIGEIGIEEGEEGEESRKSYSLKQDIIGSFAISMAHLFKPFVILTNVLIENGKLKNEFNRDDVRIFVDGGSYIWSDQTFNVPRHEFELKNDTTYVYLQVTSSGGKIIDSNKLIPYRSNASDGSSSQEVISYQLGTITWTNTGVHVLQEIENTIIMSADTYKVKTIEKDSAPDYLSGKFLFSPPGEKISGYVNSFIGGRLIENKIDEEQGITSYQIQPVFLYKDIEGFNPSLDLTLTLSNSQLKWEKTVFDGTIEVSGGLGEYLKFEKRIIQGNVDKDDITKVLKWAAEDQVKTKKQHFLMESGDNKPIKVSFNQVDGAKEGILYWKYPTDKDSGGLQASAPPSKEDKKNLKFVFAGNNENGFGWEPLSGGGGGGSIELSGSITNIFAIDPIFDETTKEEKNCLYVKTEDDYTYENKFHWVNLNENGSLDYFTYETEGFKGFEAIQVFDTVTGEPSIMGTQEYKEDEHYVLAGDDENGLYWLSLVETLSSEFSKVSVTGDDEPGYLWDKMGSDKSSLLFESKEDDDGVTYLNVNINPAYFVSSDGSILIESSEDDEGSFLDIKLSAHMVQIDNVDPIPGYLDEKLEVDDSLASFITLQKVEDVKMVLSSVIQGTGLIAVNEGKISVLEAPAEGEFALTVKDGVFTWTPVAICEDACSTPEEGEGEGEQQ